MAPRFTQRRRSRPFEARRPRKKLCRFCVERVIADYKQFSFLRGFLNDRAKILPRRVTGTCAWHQRRLTKELKKARVLGFLPFAIA